jgi:hypothetical protein
MFLIHAKRAGQNYEECTSHSALLYETLPWFCLEHVNRPGNVQKLLSREISKRDSCAHITDDCPQLLWVSQQGINAASSLRGLLKVLQSFDDGFDVQLAGLPRANVLCAERRPQGLFIV